MRIPPIIAETRLRTVHGWEGNQDLRRAIQLAVHMADRIEITVEEALEVLLPGGNYAVKHRTLDQVAKSVGACGADVTLEIIGAKQLSGSRRVGFSAERVTESEPRLTELGTVGETFVGHQVATVQRNGKPLVRVFLSYNAKDATKAAELWTRLREFASIDRTYQFEFWDFASESLLPGDDWHQRVLAAIAQGDIGIFAVSHHFLNSEYIHQYELPDFVSRHAAVPVLLEEFDLDMVDLKGLEGRQIFRPDGRSFDSMRGERAKNAWVEALRDSIHQVLERRGSSAPEIVGEQRRARPQLLDLDAVKYFEPLYGRPGRLPGDPDAAIPQGGSRVDAVEHLVEWARAGAAPLAAVLGEYGTGKTITCQAVVRELHRRREGGELGLPEPMYFDLRHVSRLRQREMVPTLQEILDECIARGWSAGESGRPTTNDLLDRSKRNPALFIIDGLDEALVHLNRSDGNVFTRELLSLRPPGKERDPVAGRDTKILLSCRTHYFRSVAEQYGHFLGQHRETADRGDFEALLLLPFTEDQVRAYLARAVPDRDSGQVYEMLASLHDLSDLTSRPVTLKLVAQQVSFIEQRRLKGEPTHAADIYQRVVETWVERDGGKEQLRARDKLALTARLAAWMWQRNDRILDIGVIEDWLHEQLEADQALHRRYGRVHPDVLEEDLRTATFLVRQDTYNGTQTKGFRFAHTSFQEFFVARFLLDAIEHRRMDDWSLEPSDETLDFLGQLIHDHQDRETLLDTLSGWRITYKRRASELLLRYALHAAKHNLPAPRTTGMDLSGAALRYWEICGTEQNPIDLTGARLSTADLRDSRIDFVDFSHADLTAVRLDRATAHGCRFEHCDLSRAQIVGGFLHHCTFTYADLSGADLRGLRHVGDDAALPDPPPSHRQTLTSSLVRAGGFSPGAVAWAPDGARLLSGDANGAIRIWDADTGEPLSTFRIPFGKVSSVTWSPDGTRILTGDSEGTARIWDSGTGSLLLVLTPHAGSVSAVAWAPDGARILTGDSKGAIQVWNARNGAKLPAPANRQGSRVQALAWSPDGKRFLTGNLEGTARTWNADDGAPLLTLTRNIGSISAVAWSPDGRQLLTGGSNSVVRLWDADSGVQLRTPPNSHDSGVGAAAWLPDGSRLLIGNRDGSVLIWDSKTNYRTQVMAFDFRRAAEPAMAWSPDGTRLVTGSGDGAIQVWDAETSEPLARSRYRWSGVVAAGWSPDSTRLLIRTSEGTVSVRNADTGIPLVNLTSHTTPISAATWSPDSTRLLIRTSEGTVSVRNADTGVPLVNLTSHTTPISAATWSPDSTRLLTGDSEGTATIWDAQSGAIVRNLTSHSSPISAVSWSSDGTRLLTGDSEGTATIWNAGTGTLVRRLVWNYQTGSISAMEWAPDSTRYLVGSREGTATVWDSRGNEPLVTFSPHGGPISAVAWSPDGTKLLTRGENSPARVWDANTGDPLEAIQGSDQRIEALAWSLDRTRLLASEGDGFVSVRDLDGVELLRIVVLPENESAAWSRFENRLHFATSEAWRYLRAACFDPDGRLIGLQPYERYFTP
ncbi:pentapeptide repeat-containing protein [Nocardia sp. SC052]|uniref:WD40 domain-containing protein n=1 Tax=Nocardia sichangensis TaxID=3385975 RepID=UPI0039A12336